MKTSDVVQKEFKRSTGPGQSSIILYALGKNLIFFHGSNMPNALSKSVSYSSVNFGEPTATEHGIIALTIKVINDGGRVIAEHDCIHQVEFSPSGILLDLDKTFVPPVGRLCSVNDSGLTALVANQRLATYKLAGHKLVDADLLCGWIAEQLTDEELLATVTVESELEKAMRRISQLEALNSQFDKAMERKDQRIDTLWQELQDTKEILSKSKTTLQEKDEELTKAYLKLSDYGTSLRSIFEVYAKLNLFETLFLPSKVDSAISMSAAKFA
jgi:uncharacterized membrane-anchored protein YhcB (DUF1043 family)